MTALVVTLAVAAASFAGTTLVVFALGAATLALHRAGLLRFFALYAARIGGAGVRASAADVALACVTTCCGCATHAGLHALRASVSGERRALRFLALASTLRFVPCAAALACCARDGVVWPLVLAIAPGLVFAMLVARNATLPALNAASLFVERSSRAAPSRAISDAWSETREMLSRYPAHIAGASLAAGLLASMAGSSGGWPAPLVVVCAALAPLLGRVVRVDAIALAPCAAVLIFGGVDALVVVPLLAIADASAIRTHRVVNAYLTPAAAVQWRRTLWRVAFVTATLSLVTALAQAA